MQSASRPLWAYIYLNKKPFFKEKKGLCNGTRLKIESLGKIVVTCSFIDDERANSTVSSSAP